ncbi:MAG: glycine/sarcosine/betaine reductase component B subunit [Bacillota bacterium]|nr:glycine/sarcosine/betaine reductase component B subunit [Bacillota bacterium]
MDFKLGRIKIKDIQFGVKTEIINSKLYINKEEMEKKLRENEAIKNVKVEIAKPGESIRIIPIKDIIEPRVKVNGNGGVFPGFESSVESVGEGQTNVLEGVAVISSGKIVNFQEGLIDMSGPAADYVHFSKTLNIVLLIEPVDYLDKHAHEEAVRVTGLKAAAYIGEAGRNIKPDEVETYDNSSLIEKVMRNMHLPKVVYIPMVLSQGLLHDTYIYGLDAKGILPTLINPAELMDGAVVSGNCAGPCHKNVTFLYQNNPIIEELSNLHGKTICFMGAIITNENAMLKCKDRSSSYVAKICKSLGIDGAIISEDGGGNPETDLMMNCRKLEASGIKTVLVTDEYAGRDGGSQGLADITPEADAVVTNGNGNMLLKLPPMDKVLGYPEVVEIITGGFEGSLKKDGSIEVEIAALTSSCNEVGFGRLTTKMR